MTKSKVQSIIILVLLALILTYFFVPSYAMREYWDYGIHRTSTGYTFVDHVHTPSHDIPVSFVYVIARTSGFHNFLATIMILSIFVIVASQILKLVNKEIKIFSTLSLICSIVAPLFWILYLPIANSACNGEDTTHSYSQYGASFLFWFTLLHLLAITASIIISAKKAKKATQVSGTTTEEQVVQDEHVEEDACESQENQ